MPNITLAMDEALLKSARAFAKSEGTTLNGVIRKLLIGAMAKEAQREEARLALIELMNTSDVRLPKGYKLDRDEMYGGPILPGHKHSGVRDSQKRRRA
jgi:hypothetical protein